MRRSSVVPSLLVAFALSFASTPAHAVDGICLRAIGAVAGSAVHAGKALYYPVVLGAHAIDRVAGLFTGRHDGWRSFVRDRFRRDRWHALAFLTMLGLSPTHVSFHEYQRATAAFDRATPAGVTVVVDAFPDNDPLYPRAGRYVYEQRYRADGALLVEASNADELAKALADIVKQHGPIGKLDYYGHGFPGRVLFPNESMAQMPTLPFLGAGAVPDGVGRLRGVFAPGAQVRFNACFVGNGEHGDTFVDAFAERFLPAGGKIYTSSLQMIANPVEYGALFLNTPEPPGWLRTAAQPARAPLGVWTAANLAYLAAHPATEGRPRERIVIRNVAPVEKRTDPAIERAFADYLRRLRELSDDVVRQPEVREQQLLAALGLRLADGRTAAETVGWQRFSFATGYWAVLPGAEASRVARELRPQLPRHVHLREGSVGASGMAQLSIDRIVPFDFGSRLDAAVATGKALEAALDRSTPTNAAEERLLALYRQRLAELRRWEPSLEGWRRYAGL